MFRKTFTGTLVAASLTAGAVLTMSSASASPTWVDTANVSHSGLLPENARVTMSENGTAVATWVRSVAGVDRIQASHFSAGSWTFPDTLTYAEDEVSDPDVAMNDKGEAVVTWLEKDNGDEIRINVSRYLGDGVFDGLETMTKANDLSATAGYDLGMDGAGKLFVAHRDTDGGAINKVRVSTLTKAGVIGNFSFSDDEAYSPDIAVNNGGDALLAFRDQEVGDDIIQVRRFNAANSSWSTSNPVGSPATYSSTEVETALSDTGAGTVAYSRQDGDGDYRATANKVDSTGLVSSLNIVSPAGSTAGGLSLSQNDAGTALLSWNETDGGNRIRFSTRPQTSGWATSSLVPGPVNDFSRTKAAISDSGTLFIGFADNGHQRAAYKASQYTPLTTFDSGALGFVDDETTVGIDNQGNAVLGGVIKDEPNSSFVHAAFLDIAGPVASLTAVGSGANTYAKKFNVTWNATDRFSDVGPATIRVRTAAWNGVFGSYSYPFVNESNKTVTFNGAAGRTYCFEVQVRDANGTAGAYSAPKCTTTPVDDRAGVIAKGFKRAKASTSYLGTYTIAKKKNAVMSLQHVKASRIAILVTKVAKGGKIQVSFAGKKLGSFSLKGSGNKKLIGFKNLGSLKSGTLVIRVISKTGKVVRIDGVVIAK